MNAVRFGDEVSFSCQKRATSRDAVGESMVRKPTERLNELERTGLLAILATASS
jgi:hypothetical protein